MSQSADRLRELRVGDFTCRYVAGSSAAGFGLGLFFSHFPLLPFLFSLLGGDSSKSDLQGAGSQPRK